MNKTVSPSKYPVALIAGPTASGKSALAVRLAEIADGVVINADASQVYADLRVLSARPDVAEEARAPHRLFGYRDAAESCSAADWAEDAKREIAEAQAAGKLPILVGGSGLYLRTLIFGIAPVPEIEPAIRSAVRALPIEAAREALAAEDPAMAHLRPRDATRIARALEVIRSTGRSLSQWQAELTGGIIDRTRLAAAILLPPRDWLRDRCDRRFETMLDRGAIEEATKLRDRGLDPTLPAMQAIGVRDIIAWQDGLVDRATMVARAQAATRQYAKRQYTWFRHQPPDDWERITAQLNDSEIEKIAIKLRSMALTE
ncbi:MULTISPECIES: tRNA (adenosine(37)-N6)-dimethylallyltransferase MiaA [unclassified Sphingomonas]|uniref:tRNA (adenosine(37)-N6)-dimethylallyltransferase MiaA n=1 Tax=unclassified Sphingomonas TaxID=196159 RepID=UPI0007021763|nr:MULTISPECIES: tRNA (adenosine(37)-N6)-dimethylallyltransferase MiaA [unclassified Sphingomonas]KQX18491.1 tRNA dimethylallyltransferase [Sphingomonas sp. Root1294]KQY72385.1 tRNA dimethylallyltransferase [Sphingomonas sp. Root50]KRB94542.1 tRNA dimethylallyltransferase [Sphingomonas sp. Root720]